MRTRRRYTMQRYEPTLPFVLSLSYFSSLIISQIFAVLKMHFSVFSL